MTRAWAALLWSLALAPLPAGAEPVREVTLDIDRDGTPDRARIVAGTDGIHAALQIELFAGSRTVTHDLTTEPILALEATDRGSLVVSWGRGGANDYTARLTIVHRRGTFWVGGFTMDWDTRNGIGRCDVNFLTGKAVAARGLNADRPVAGRFKPVRLADWSEDKIPRPCRSRA